MRISRRFSAVCANGTEEIPRAEIVGTGRINGTRLAMVSGHHIRRNCPGVVPSTFLKTREK